MQIKIKITTSENSSFYNVPVGTIVEEDFEKYVAAVVASEIGNAPLEACKAQAVASRSFAYRYILKGKEIPDTSSSAQAFRIKRYSDAYAVCIEAAKSTKEQILQYGDAVVDAYFCHSNGGNTTSSEERWGGARDYLVSVPDKWDAATHTNRIGHGVGMSQVGAKYAAEHGVSYKDILSFYYPRTKIVKISVKREDTKMISLDKFLNGCKRNAARIKSYKLGCNGSNGMSDCVGYIIGALDLEGQKWGGIHGSNYAARYRTKNLRSVTNESQLKLGDLVYKVRKPGVDKYDLPSRYRVGGSMYTGDLNDYYHIGVVTAVNPLTISHCSGGGMHYDKKLGKWSYAGECSLVTYDGVAPVPHKEDSVPSPVTGIGKAIVDVPDDTTVNIRSAMSTSSKVLVRAKEGTEVEVLSVTGAWAKVSYSFSKTGIGYVMSRYISSENTIDVPNDTTVNVRLKASINSTKVTTLPEGSKVTILSKYGEWSRIEYSEPKVGTGYVMNKYLKKG